jgi:hypothetical protein
LGAGTTAVQKVGTKTKDELSRLALEAREAKDPKKLWKDAKKDILKETQPLSLLDAQGNPLPVTREFLTSLGVNPEAKALAGVPMESILNQPATDGGVAQTLVKYFTDKIQDINTTLERKDLTDERRSELTSTYESLSTGLKTFTQRATEAKKEKERAEREAQTIPVFKLPEGFEFKKKNDKALAGELIDPQGRSRGKFASIEEAGLFANTLYKPATPITPTAPAAPEPTFEAPTPEPVETVDVTADRLAGEPVVEAAPEARIEPTLGEAPVAAPAPTVTPEPTLEAAPAPTVTPEPTPTPTAEAAPIPEPAPQVAEQIQALRDDYGMDGLASAISSRPAAEQVQLTQQVSDTLAQIDQLETNRKALRAQNDQASIKAVGEQIRKLENSLDDLEYTLTNVPNTRAEVQAVVKASGNAAEANKIAADINKENGCK